MGAPNNNSNDDFSNDDSYHSLRILDAAILLMNIYRGAQSSKVRFEDAARTLEELVVDLHGKKGIRVQRSVIESALWSCNLLDELGKFWHPKGRSFDEFLKDILKCTKTNLFYHRRRY